MRRWAFPLRLEFYYLKKIQQFQNELESKLQYEQNQLIENYSKQLEILNESKTKLISYNNLSDVYKGIIDLLSDNIDNVFRVSILVHDLERNAGNLFFKDPVSKSIAVKKEAHIFCIGIGLLHYTGMAAIPAFRRSKITGDDLCCCNLQHVALQPACIFKSK